MTDNTDRPGPLRFSNEPGWWLRAVVATVTLIAVVISVASALWWWALGFAAAGLVAFGIVSILWVVPLDPTEYDDEVSQ